MHLTNQIKTHDAWTLTVKQRPLCHRAAGPASSQPHPAWVRCCWAAWSSRPTWTTRPHWWERFPWPSRITRTARSEGSIWFIRSQRTQRWISDYQVCDHTNMWPEETELSHCLEDSWGQTTITTALLNIQLRLKVSILYLMLMTCKFWASTSAENRNFNYVSSLQATRATEGTEDSPQEDPKESQVPQVYQVNADYYWESVMSSPSDSDPHHSKQEKHISNTHFIHRISCVCQTQFRKWRRVEVWTQITHRFLLTL